ncbi:hypothetical protein JCM16814_33390 [Desulfobaculum senezii]
MIQAKETAVDALTKDFLDKLAGGGAPSTEQRETVMRLYALAREAAGTAAIVAFFAALREMKRASGLGYEAFGLTREALVDIARLHAERDEHGVSVGGRVGRAYDVLEAANDRVETYLAQQEAVPDGEALWESMQQNAARIRSVLGMSDDDWNSFSGQLRHAINDVETLAKCVELPQATIREVTRVTEKYRMRLTPYYASLIMPGVVNDPVLLQAVPTAEMVDNMGVELPPVASDHSPARLIDQFYPRVVAVKVTNMCAMYCTHCLRIAHIGKADRVFPREAYTEALNYIRSNPRIRDVLITGGDAFMLPNETLGWLLEQLDNIPHVQMKRLGTRVPVTTPQRVDDALLGILAASNDKSPVRVVTQVNTAQELTPVSRAAFKAISGQVSAILNQAVLLRGINDSRPKMWKLCETLHASYIRPYYVFNCSYRNPQYTHMRVPVEKGRDIIESMYGNISGDAIPRYIAAAGGKIPLHRSNVMGRAEDGGLRLRKPWNGEETVYPDADTDLYADDDHFAFARTEGEDT